MLCIKSCSPYRHPFEIQRDMEITNDKKIILKVNAPLALYCVALNLAQIRQIKMYFVSVHDHTTALVYTCGIHNLVPTNWEAKIHREGGYPHPTVY